MGLTWKEEHLDYILVPSGLLILLGYHLFHLHKCLECPETTVIGYENHNRKVWVARILQVETKDRGLAVSVINANISAATSLSSISLTLSSLIGAWIGSSYTDNYISSAIYGNTSRTTVYIKYISLLACFMIAFVCFVQTVRCYVQANFLITMPNCEMPVKNVESTIIRGSNFWVVGLRSLYFATNLLLWIFGPIPMFVSSVVMVGLLCYMEINSTPLPHYEKLKRVDKEISEVSGNTDQKPEESKRSPHGTTSNSSPNGK